jgi:hypothetical protein
MAEYEDLRFDAANEWTLLSCREETSARALFWYARRHAHDVSGLFDEPRRRMLGQRETFGSTERRVDVRPIGHGHRECNTHEHHGRANGDAKRHQ